MTRSEVSYLKRVIEGNVYWLPQSIPQWLAWLSRADVTFYGGQAGGGKTDLMLGLGLECHQRGTIFRRVGTELQDLIDRGDEILAPSGIQFKYQPSYRWRFGKERFLEARSIQYEKDTKQFKGRARDFYAFDEVSDFTEFQFRFLPGWLRSEDTGQRKRVIAAGNPPTSADGEWIVQFFGPWLNDQHPYPANPGELRYFAVIEGKDVEVEDATPFTDKGIEIVPQSRTFIPAKLSDNVFLRETGYASVLASLEEPLRSQLLFGDFSIKADDNPWQVIPTAWVEAAQKRWEESSRPELALKAVGVDVARGGRDETCIAKLYGEYFELITYPGSETKDGPEVKDKVMLAMVDDRIAPVWVDAIGVGGSAYDFLHQSIGDKAHPVDSRETSYALDKNEVYGFANLRSQMWWQFREALDPNGDHKIALPPDRNVKIDLCVPTFKPVSKGIQVISKEDMKIQRSTNAGDAIIYAWYGATAGIIEGELFY